MDGLFDAVYERLHGHAKALMRGQSAAHTLQTTALVHEMYARLFAEGGGSWADRRHFLAVAGRAMRSILVDHARRKMRQKRGGGAQRVPMSGVSVDLGDRHVDVIALDEALAKLAEVDPRAARVVECRFFGQYTMDEISTVLDVPKRSVERDWTFARLWLRRFFEA